MEGFSRDTHAKKGKGRGKSKRVCCHTGLVALLLLVRGAAARQKPREEISI